MTLPVNRWNGIWSPAPMRELVDAISHVLGDRRATPTNDFAGVHESLLPILRWQLDALAYDPAGPETQRRRALALAKRLHSLIGTESAFDILMQSNFTRGALRYIGDFNSSGVQVPRVGDRMQGSHSLHSADPLVEDTLRDPDGNPTGNRNPAFSGDGHVYRKFVAIDIIQPSDRAGDINFTDYIASAAQQVVPYTLEVVETNIVIPIDLDAEHRIGVHAYTTQYVSL